MAERTQENSNGCWPRSSDVIMYKLGYLQATCDRILIAVTAMQTAPPKASGRMNLRESWKDLGEYVKGFELIVKLWRLYRAVPWGTLAWGLYVLARWLHPF